MVEIINFGQYKGKSIDWVNIWHTGYAGWLMRNREDIEHLRENDHLTGRLTHVYGILRCFVPEVACFKCNQPAFYTFLDLFWEQRRTKRGSTIELQPDRRYVQRLGPERSRFTCVDHLLEARREFGPDADHFPISYDILGRHPFTKTINLPPKIPGGKKRFRWGDCNKEVYVAVREHLMACMGLGPEEAANLSYAELEQFIDSLETSLPRRKEPETPASQLRLF